MNYLVTYDFAKYRPSNFAVFRMQSEFKKEITSLNSESAKKLVGEEYGINPFYLKAELLTN